MENLNLQNKIMESKKVVIIPGSFSLVSVYGGYDGLDIWLNEKLDEEKLKNADLVIAHSAGVNYLFSQPIYGNQKIILINPLVKKRNWLSLLIRDIKFFIAEGIDKDKIIPLSDWFYASIKVLKLLGVNVLENLRKLSKENVVIIRGMGDCYFCDSENADLIKSEGFTLFEVDAKHNWNQNIAEMVNKIICDMLIQKD